MRANHNIDERRPLQQFAAFRLRNAPGDSNEQAITSGGSSPITAHPVKPTKLRINFFGGLVANVAGVEDDEVRLGRIVDAPVSFAPQQFGHPRRVVDIHLAAEGLDMEPFLHVHLYLSAT